MRYALALLIAGLAIPATAQTALLTASPIPEGAESRFCYYAGLAYSKNAYLLIGGNNQSAQMTGGTIGSTGDAGGALHSGGQIQTRGEQKPLECVEGDDGVLRWTSVATIQISK
ncbi:hypothetical protein R3X27_16535 [Tropicimonas sp. TH_r6]|uniref:hypothetical protein n=1 Tax=Tropicimonas sp. TH_r6 TaxID=3082085 RepID=UPI002955349C|nr:hypothetical protein [Tropicimonas sp. TH_r6]MDV7144293.1 hypothetical protein [Tropicimonas sp. TH_r6]